MNDAGTGRWTRGGLWLAVMLAVMLIVTVAVSADTTPIIATGTVTDAQTGEPIAGVVVQLGILDEAPLSETITGADGTYTLGDLHGTGAGWYEFRFVAVGYRIPLITGYWDGVTPLELDPQLTAADVIATGRVTDALTGEGIGGARVYAGWRHLSGGYIGTGGDATTDADGNYVLYSSYGFGEGEYRFKVTASGYRTQEHVEIWDGLAPLADINFSLSPMVVATGTVTDAVTGEGIEGASVHAFYDGGEVWQWVAGAQTDENGDYAIYDTYGHGADHLRFEVMEAEGYLNPEHRDEYWDGETPLSDIDFALQRAPIIATGTVTDAVTGYGVGEAYVVFLWFDGHDWDWGGAADTNVDGDYTLYDYYGNAAGDYRFYAGAGAGYSPSDPVDRTWDGTTPLALNFEIEPIVLAEGTVVDAATSVGIEEAWIEAEYYDEDEESWVWAGFTWTGEDGSYTLNDQSRQGAGEYRFTAGARGYARQAQQLTWDGWNPLAVNFALEAADVIAMGTVTDASTGGPLSNAMVEAEFYDGEKWVVVAVDFTEDGAYLLYDHFGHGAGGYRFRASALGYLESGAINRTWDGATPLALDFALHPDDATALASGTVTDASNGEPIEGAGVTVWWYDEFGSTLDWLGTAYADEDGVYTFYPKADYGAGDYEFVARANGYRYSARSETWDGETPLDLDFMLEPADTVATGNVSDASTGAGIQGATVFALWREHAGDSWEWAAWAGDAETDEHGAYTLYDSWGHGAGEYRLRASATGYLDSEHDDISWDGGNPLVVDIGLEPAAVIASGLVTDASSGEGIEGASVAAWVDGKAEWDPPQAWTETDENGAYTLYDYEGTGAGKWRFEVSAPGYAVQHREGTWDGVMPLTLDFPLGAVRLLVTGTVTDASTGLAISGADIEAEWYDALTSTWRFAGWASTDMAGGYTIYDNFGRGVGGYRFTVQADGYALQRINASWDGEDALTVDLALQPDVKPPPLLPQIIKGNDRYLTAIAGSKAAFADGAPAVVIATGENFADALGGAGLAGALDSPLLLTKKASLPGPVMTEIGRLKASKAYILGGTSAVSGAVEFALKSKLGSSNVIRIAGPNRYDTANRVAAETIRLLGTSYTGDAFIATGANFPDALGASPIAAAKGMPVYLADPARTSVSLPASVKRVWITGGRAVVSPETEASLKRSLGNANVKRLAGDDRFDTAAQVAAFGVSRGMTWNGVGITTGMNFPDALAAGPVLGSRDAVMLLTNRDSVPPHTERALRNNRTSIDRVTFFGGDAAVPLNVRQTVLKLVK